MTLPMLCIEFITKRLGNRLGGLKWGVRIPRPAFIFWVMDNCKKLNSNTFLINCLQNITVDAFLVYMLLKDR